MPHQTYLTGQDPSGHNDRSQSLRQQWILVASSSVGISCRGTRDAMSEQTSIVSYPWWYLWVQRHASCKAAMSEMRALVWTTWMVNVTSRLHQLGGECEHLFGPHGWWMWALAWTTWVVNMSTCLGHLGGECEHSFGPPGWWMLALVWTTWVVNVTSRLHHLGGECEHLFGPHGW